MFRFVYKTLIYFIPIILWHHKMFIDNCFVWIFSERDDAYIKQNVTNSHQSHENRLFISLRRECQCLWKAQEINKFTESWSFLFFSGTDISRLCSDIYTQGNPNSPIKYACNQKQKIIINRWRIIGYIKNITTGTSWMRGGRGYERGSGTQKRIISIRNKKLKLEEE